MAFEFGKESITSASRILLIYPHPDDEAFGNAGFVIRALAQGAKVKAICLTKGEASTLRFGIDDPTKLSTTRETEYKAVMAFLGVIDYKILDFADGKLDAQSADLTNVINTEIKTFAPSVVITFEPWGIYGHPDHVFISKLITDIYKTQNRFKLVYTTVAKNFKSPDEWLNMARDKNKVKPITPNFIFRLSVNEYIKKLKTLNLYKSQVNMRHDFFNKIYQIYKLLNEYYYVVPQNL